MPNGPGKLVPSTQWQFSARFRIDPRMSATALALRSDPDADAAGPLEILFTQVSSHDVPAQLDGLRIDAPTDRNAAAAGDQRHYALTSAGRRYHVVARGVRIHEPLRLYDRSMQLPHFGIAARLFWTLLLWIARFDWGQALIRRLRAR